jgi:hypothetical protein
MLQRPIRASTIVAAASCLALLAAGCNGDNHAKAEPTKTEHPKADAEHPKPEGEHPKADGEHPKKEGEHPKGDG